MNCTWFFIDRPIFAGSISIAIVLAGLISLSRLPISQYPSGIAPTTIQVQSTYLGANAQVVEETVAAPIEEQVNGAEGMLYMSSTSANDGTMTLTVTFDVGRDADLAAVDVQNRVALATPSLPADVVRQGIRVTKRSPDILVVGSLISPEGKFDSSFSATSP